jgi:PAS domain S-box-containing protein
MNEQIKILLIEDNPGDARLIDIYLKDSFGDKYSLLIADYLTKGIEFLLKNIFDIVILDLTLPDSNGLDTFKKIYEDPSLSKTPIIVLTGVEDESVGINAMKLGAQDFLVKGSIRGKELRRSINYSIERFKLLKALADNAKKLEKKSEDLEREQLKLSEAQKIAHIGNWEWDIEKNNIIWSEELYHIYGLNPQELTISSDKISNMMHAADRAHISENIAEAKKTHEPFSFYYRIITADNSVKTIHTRGKVILDKTGQLIKMIGTDQDVTDRVQKAELEKLMLAATQSYNSVIIFDKNQKVEWVNEGFTRLADYTLKDFNNKPIGILRGTDSNGISQQKNVFDSILKEKKPITYENINYTKNGKAYWVITTATPILDKDGEVERVIAIESDISLRKQIEEKLLAANEIAEQSLQKANKTLDELTKAKKQLEESLKVKEQFMANMSHEIRTPMNAIVGFTDLLLKTEITAEQKQFIDAVKTSGKNLLVIINDILDFSKMQSGKFVFEQIEFRLSQVISMITELMLPKSVEKNIRLSAIIEKDIPDFLIGDPLRLNQIILNLLGNAIKFTNQGEIKIEVRLMTQKENFVELQFSIIDTGLGIPENKLSSIFEEFTQASNETTRQFGGTGLGLSIVKQLVELQGGNVSVQSKLGVGSTFMFNLKFKIKNQNEFKKNEKKINDETKLHEKLDGLTVLLVEDNLLNQILAKKVLSDWKLNVELAENGLIAIEKLKKNTYDFILMDIQMPEMDGYAASAAIRKNFSTPKNNIPIIAMTAHALTGEEEKCIQAGMNGYISKPFDPEVLYSKILSVLKENNFFKTN